MLRDHEAVATIAVKNLPAAKSFYEGTLGMRPFGPQQPGAAVYQSGGSIMYVYESQYAGTNQATAVTWSLGGEFEEAMRALKERGVKFKHYELPETRVQGDVHIMDGMRAAWFKDPDGNILSIIDQ